MIRTRESRRGLAVLRVLPGLIGLALLIGGILMVTRKESRTWTVSEVTREMRRIALEGGEDGSPMAGTLGPLRIAARTIDAASGDFLDFRIDSDRLLVSARRAVLMVDPVANTFAFDLHDVVFTRIPDEGEDGASGKADGDAGATPLALGRAAEGGSFVHTTERHLFGPADFGQDIVPDGSERSVRGARPARGLSPRGANAVEAPNTSWLRDAGAD